MKFLIILVHLLFLSLPASGWAQKLPNAINCQERMTSGSSKLFCIGKSYSPIKKAQPKDPFEKALLLYLLMSISQGDKR